MSAPAGLSNSPAAPWLARGITATWWYTAGSVIFIHITVLSTWGLTATVVGPVWPRLATGIVFVLGSALSLGGAALLLAEYRRSGHGGGADRIRRPSSLGLSGIAASLASAALLGMAASSWLLSAGLTAYALALLRWRPGARLRLVTLAAVVLVIVWWVEREQLSADFPTALVMLPIFAVLLAPTAVLSLWWWDIVVELDRSRAAEIRLAAAQERLRLAGDLHDLQGHHLQVIALQLELAERMLPHDPATAAEQVRLARASVDDARRGTRELAGRFRGVPLGDELANAADLLRAAGIEVDLAVAPDAGVAPVDVLGPVIRESTTNVLKHGGGRWAALSLEHRDGAWRLQVANDTGDGGSTLGIGAGLSSIAERAHAVGGELRSGVDGERFDLVVTVPSAVATTAGGAR